MENGYAMIDSPNTVDLEFEILPILIGANSEVGDNVGKCAVQYGPFIYCVEALDNIENLNSLYIDKNISAEREYCIALDSYVLKLNGFRKCSCASLYERYTESFEPFVITAIPYHTFANRDETNMAVWIKVR